MNTRLSKGVVEQLDVIETEKAYFESLAKRVSELPTAELVAGFNMANQYTKSIDKFVSAAKKELVDNAKQVGRFITEGVSDEKGHLYLEGADGQKLKAEKRVFAKFNVEKARQLLVREGLEKEGSLREVECTHAGMAVGFINELKTMDVSKECATVLKLLEDLFVVNYTPDEKKVEALIVLGSLPVDAAEEVMDVSIQYAVKEVK